MFWFTSQFQHMFQQQHHSQVHIQTSNYQLLQRRIDFLSGRRADEVSNSTVNVHIIGTERQAVVTVMAPCWRVICHTVSLGTPRRGVDWRTAIVYLLSHGNCPERGKGKGKVGETFFGLNVVFQGPKNNFTVVQ